MMALAVNPARLVVVRLAHDPAQGDYAILSGYFVVVRSLPVAALPPAKVRPESPCGDGSP